MFRPFVIIAAVCLLAGSLGTLAVKAREIDTARTLRHQTAEAVAQRDLANAGYQVIALDGRPRFQCGPGSTGFEFTAVRDHSLITGGVCAPTTDTGASLIVALPPLR